MIFLVIFGLIFLESAAENSCNPRDVEIYGSCYQFNNLFKTFDDAKSYCANQGYVLTRIPNSQTGYFLTSQAVQQFGETYGTYWIGLYEVKDSFYWLDGQAFVYSNWQSGFARDGYPNAAIQLSNSKWISTLPEKELPFICNYEKGGPVPGTVEPSTTPGGFQSNCDENGLNLVTRCYYFVNKYLNRTEAAKECARSQRTLAVFDTLYQINFVGSVAVREFGNTYGSYWIGYHLSDGKYRWDDGTRNTLTNWDSGYPFTGHDSALQKLSNAKWMTTIDSQQSVFVCSGTI